MNLEKDDDFDFDNTGAEKGMVRLFINIGKRDHVKPRDILGVAAGESGMLGKLVGAIDMYDKCTFVEVPREYGREVLESMKNAKIKGHSVSLEGKSEMKWTTLGIVLRYYREKYGFSQAEISQGICSVATLSRVEAGEREIDSLVGEMLLGRVGKEITQFELMLNEDDYRMWMQRDEISKAVQNGEYESAKQKIKQYRMRLNKDQYLHHQFCKYYEAKIAIALWEDKEKIYTLAYEALELTKPQHTMSDRDRQRYTPFEVELILILIQNGNFEAAEQPIDGLEVLLSYVETYYTGQKREKLGIEILLELIRQNERNESCGDVIKYVDKALLFLSESRSMEHVAELHYRKAMAVRKKYGKAAEWDEVCKRECKLAYFVARMMKDDKLTDKVLRYCKEKLEWQITEQEILFV